MRVSKAIGLAAVLTAPALVSVSLAQNAPECPIAGTFVHFWYQFGGRLQRRARRSLPVPAQDRRRHSGFEHCAKPGKRSA